MDRTRRTLARIPGLSFVAAAALTVALEAAIGIGASLSLASGVPSLSGAGSPTVHNVVSSATNQVSSATSQVSSATNQVSSAVSNSSGAVSGTVSTATHSVAGTVSGAQQSLVSTPSNLSSTASSASSTAGQVVGSAAGAASAPSGSGPAAAQAGSGATSAGSSSSTGAGAVASSAQGGSSGRAGSSSGSNAAAARHQWYVRRLVLRLSGCVGALPPRSQQVLVLAAGIGGERPSSAAKVARILHISRAREQRVESSAVTELQQSARQGSCNSAGNPLPVSAVALGGRPGLALLSGPEASAQAFVPAARALARKHPRRAVRAMQLSRHHPGGSGVDRSAIGTPSAAGSVTSPWIWVLLGLFLAAGSALIGRQRLRARPSGAPATGGALAAAAGAPSASESQADHHVEPADPWRPASAPAESSLAEPPASTLGGLAGGAAAGAWDPLPSLTPLARDEPAPLDPERSQLLAPAAPGFEVAGSRPAPAIPAASGPASLGRPRARAGRNWMRRHRQASAMAGAVAGGVLALMLSAAERPARMVSRRRRSR